MPTASKNFDTLHLTSTLVRLYLITMAKGYISFYSDITTRRMKDIAIVNTDKQFIFKQQTFSGAKFHLKTIWWLSVWKLNHPSCYE